MKFINLLTGIALLLSAAASAREPEMTFGVLNQRSPTLTAQYWNPILQYVSEKSGVPLKMRMGRTAQETSAMTQRGEFEFVYSNHIFTVENRPAGYRVFARPDEKPVQGQLVVLDESPVHVLGDLEGKEVAFPNQSAFLGYYVTMDALLRAGIRTKSLFSGNQEGAMGQLKAGRVVAAGVHSEVMHDFAQREQIKYRVVWTSGGYLNLPLAAHPSVPQAKVKAVRDAFIGMGKDPEGVKILAASSALIKQKPLAGFVPSSDREYENVVNFYRSSLVKGQ